jgi:hypothetical protein
MTTKRAREPRPDAHSGVSHVSPLALITAPLQDLRTTLRQQLEATANIAAEGQGGQPADSAETGN